MRRITNKKSGFSPSLIILNIFSSSQYIFPSFNDDFVEAVEIYLRLEKNYEIVKINHSLLTYLKTIFKIKRYGAKSFELGFLQNLLLILDS